MYLQKNNPLFRQKNGRTVKGVNLGYVTGDPVE
jgi:hypothetical protein